jgi:transposase-like protein
MRDHSKKMRRLYQDWLTGNMSKASFCRQHKIKYSTFHYWIKKLSKEDSPAVASFQENGFSQISISEPIATSHSLQPSAVLTFPSGVRLELFAPLEAGFLKSLL